jgi:tetratricopeptide (TPR) repeat protein
VALVLFLGTGTGAVFLWAQYHLDAARSALDRHALDEAEHHLGLCAKVYFRSAAVHLLAAQTARRRDVYDKAEERLATCIELGGMTEATALERLLLTTQQGDLKAEGLLKSRPADDPNAVLVLEALAKAHVNRFRPIDALEHLNALLQRQPDHPQALLMRACAWEALARTGKTEHEQDALRDYQTAVELAPSFEGRLGLAGALYRLGRPWSALIEYDKLHQLRPTNAEALLGLARCRYSLGEVGEARRLLDELLDLVPRHPAALLERGQLAFHAGQLADAENWLGQAVAVAPRSDCEPLHLLSRCLEAQHKDEEARRCRDRLRAREAELLEVDRLILQSNRDPHNVALRYRIARDLIRLGREREGVAALFLVLDQEPRHGPSHAALADYFERTGAPFRAARHRRAGSQGAGE